MPNPSSQPAHTACARPQLVARRVHLHSTRLAGDAQFPCHPGQLQLRCGHGLHPLASDRIGVQDIAVRLLVWKGAVMAFMTLVLLVAIQRWTNRLFFPVFPKGK